MWGHRTRGIPSEWIGSGVFGVGSPCFHDRFGSSSNPSLNGNLHYPNNIDRSLNEVADDKIRKYHNDYNKNPPNTVSFMPSIPSTSGRLHNEFVRLLFLQDHRETDRFFTVSGVQFVEHDRDCSTSDVRLSFNNSKAGLTWLSISHSQTSRLLTSITLANFSSINLVSIFRCSSSPRNPVYVRHVDSSPLGFSLSSHQHSNVNPVPIPGCHVSVKTVPHRTVVI